MENVVNAVNWFEIPVTDFARAKAFYSAIFDYEMQQDKMSHLTLGFLPCEPGKGIGGAIVLSDGYVPSQNGTVVYLNGGNDLNVVLNRIEKAGGKILVGKTRIDDNHGYFAIFLDSEGNKLGLHSMN
ncbi:MAG: VOC family protein [Syntrophothermus sp.]